MNIFLYIIIAYIIGSINIAIVVFNIFQKNDPRDQYSKNPGVTNVYRQAGLFWAVIVLLLEIAKAILIVFVAGLTLPPQWVPWIILAYLLGNKYPLFHSFKGGKGMAGYLGTMLYVNPMFAAFSCIAWVGAFVVFRQPFISSFFMAYTLSMGLVIAANYYSSAIAGVIVIFILLTINHFENMKKFYNTLIKKDLTKK